MRDRLHHDLTAALRTRDRVAMSALRSALAAIENAEAPPAVDPTVRAVGNEHIAGSVVGVGAAEIARYQLTAAEVRSIIEAEVHERCVQAGQYEQLGRHDLAERVRAEIDVLHAYLPPPPAPVERE